MPRGKVQKQSDALKAYKAPKVKRKWAIINWTKRHILLGESREEILKALAENYGYKDTTCESYYAKANDLALRAFSQDCDKIHTLNLARLEQVIEDNIDDNAKVAMAAIEMENKMTGAYTTKLDVKSEGDGPVFKIKID